MESVRFFTTAFEEEEDSFADPPHKQQRRESANGRKLFANSIRLNPPDLASFRPNQTIQRLVSRIGRCFGVDSG